MTGYRPTEKCVNWPLWKRRDGYGQIKVGGIYVSAHRLFYEMFNGPIPKGLHVLHTCDNPLCVNPAHLKVGTHAENMADCVAKGRRPRGVDNHKAVLTPETVREIRYSKLSVREMAEKIGCSKSAVQCVRQGITWQHVKD